MFGEIDREGVPLVAPDDGYNETGGVRIDFDVLSAPSTFRQSFHIRHRLERYGAGRCLDFDTSGPKVIAAVSDGHRRGSAQRCGSYEFRVRFSADALM